MNYRKLLIPLVLFISTLVFFSYGFINAGTAPSNYGFDVSIYPEAAKEGVFQAKLVISELTSGKIVASPTIRFRDGQPAEVTSGETQDGLSFKFSVSVDEKGSVAEYSASVSESTNEISRSQAKISLTN